MQVHVTCKCGITYRESDQAAPHKCSCGMVITFAFSQVCHGCSLERGMPHDGLFRDLSVCYGLQCYANLLHVRSKRSCAACPSLYDASSFPQYESCPTCKQTGLPANRYNTCDIVGL